MDVSTLNAWKNRLAVPGTGRQPEAPPLLTDVETAVFNLCASNNLRIEQERIPQAAVIDAVSGLDTLPSRSAVTRHYGKTRHWFTVVRQATRHTTPNDPKNSTGFFA